MADAHNIAGLAYQGLRRRPGLAKAYVHPPIASASGDESYFSLTQDGRRFKVTVREISVEEELAAALQGECV